MFYGQTPNRLPKPHMGPSRPYDSYMINQRIDAPMPPTLAMPIKVQYDYTVEGFDNVWQAHGALMAEAELMDQDVLTVKYDGVISSAGPSLTIIFKSIGAAQAYTAVYLGLDIDNWNVYTDEEVGEYLSLAQYTLDEADA